MENILIPLIIFGAIFGIIYVITTARHKEKMAMIERGADPELFRNKQLKFSQYNLFKYGLFLIGIALGLVVGGILDEVHVIDEVTGYFSSILFFGGLALIVAFLLRKKLDKD